MPENKLKKIFSSRTVLFLLLLAFVWLSLVLVRAFYKKRQLDQEIGALKSEVEKMDKKGQELNQFLGYFSSQDYLEKEAKDKLNLKKEGENVVMVQEPAAEAAKENNNSAPAGAAISAPVEENNLVKWWKFFFKR
ncbi:septum formation initiator family protein [Patescibacteria group bacterium]|nr:septum formation initiator family protein [Patescibacteria group bacterium]